MNASKSGAVLGGRGVGVNRPRGAGGSTPVIGMLMVPPVQVPDATGGPKMSCTLRTSNWLPLTRTLERSTETAAARGQLKIAMSARPGSYLLARTNTRGSLGGLSSATSVMPSPVVADQIGRLYATLSTCHAVSA